MVLVKLELEGMRQAIVHALTVRQAEVALNVDEQVKQAIEHFDAAPLIEQEVKYAVSKAIKEAIDSAVKQLFWDEEVRKIVTVAIEQALTKALVGRQKS
jgi:hypothetical protein